ncbi:hypothetical protein [Aquibacillus albus]|uniref:Uncharacterized protein n=1 Tax=Aquibacillus albus TaxID=1168171 RepID=A0ABS2N1U4_9BACI|nr:hypothetical protein [Aquibacillus albus]MBM7571875.1 hypothetical protein [Aquibacillus albus]
MNLFKQIVKLNDKISQSFMDEQILSEDSRYYGGIIEKKTGIPSPSHTGTGSVIGSWVSSFVNMDSKYYHDPELKRRISMALDYMIDQQHEDGTISPGWTNYNSPPDTGFIITGFAQIYHLLDADTSEESDQLAKKVLLFLERTIPAMLTGGCHTPNHRWVLTSALSHLYKIFGNPALVERAEEWLNEGIDITEDGEWTERSNGIYNSVSNIFLYHTAKLLNKPKLLNYVRKNLDMMKYLVHPNGDVVTEYSGRQDFGDTYDLSPYHLIYRLMAVEDNNPMFGAMSHLAAESLFDMGPVNNHVILGYLSFPWIKDVNFEKVELPKNYEVMINENFPVKAYLKKMKEVGHHSKIEHSSMHTAFGSQTVRYRNEQQSITIMTNNSSFFALRHNEAKLLGVQLYSSFSPGIIEFDTVERINSGYRLEKQMEKGYKGPILQENSSSDLETSTWYLLPHQKRTMTHNQIYQMKTDIFREGNDWVIHIQSDDRKDVFTQVVFILEADATYSGQGIEQMEEGSSFWKHGELILSSGNNRIILESGEHEHWQSSVGSPVMNNKGLHTIKVNLISPVDKTFRIRCE